MKLLYLTDTHMRGTTPRNRTDNLPVALAAKLTEVVDLARRHAVAAILHGGDLFDRPDVAPAVVREYLAILRDAPCPIYGIAGNHDLYGLNPDTLPRTMLGLFDSFRLVRLIQPGRPVRLEVEGLTVQVSGQPFHAELDRRDPRLDYCLFPGNQHQREPGVDFAVHLTHGMLLERPFIEGVAHSLLSQVMPHTEADVTLGGHYHPGWSRVYEQGDRLFINPGAMVRLGAHAADFERPVQVVLLEFQRGQRPRWELVPLQSAQPGHAVLDRSQQDAQLARQRALADFILGLGAEESLAVMEAEAIMTQVADHEGLPPAVKAEALRRLGRAQEALAAGGGEEAP